MAPWAFHSHLFESGKVRQKSMIYYDVTLDTYAVLLKERIKNKYLYKSNVNPNFAFLDCAWENILSRDISM